jgi:hypothetical protein
MALPEVLSVFVVAGGDDFLVHVAVPGVDSLHAFLTASSAGAGRSSASAAQ